MESAQNTQQATPPRRRYFAKKSDWALDQAAQARDEIRQIKAEPFPGSTHRQRQRYQTIANLERREVKFKDLARHYKAKGL
jgi:hypothetical protein